MSKVIVTGSLGFIGSHLCNLLIDEGHTVVGIDDLSGGSSDNGGRCEHIIADCRDEERMDQIFRRERPQIVYHLAANAAEGKSIYSPIDITSRNYDAFIKVLTPFIKYGGKRFVFTSSIAVYGEQQTPFKEDATPDPEDLYGISKLAIEQSLKIMSKVHGFEYVIARPHNVYGPAQNMRDPYRNVVTIWMNKALRDEPITIYGDGSMKRCFSYIDDVIDPLYECGIADIAGMTFNIGSDLAYRIDELADAIDECHSINREYLPKREQEVQDAISDHSLLRKHLGYHETPLKDGIAVTWEWAQKMGAQEPIYTPIEIMSSSLPANWIK